MIKKTITYTDYNGVERKEDFYFNLTKAEVTKMQLGTVGGLSAMLRKIIDTNDVPTLMNIFEELVLNAYGVKSDDGRRFMKNDEIRAAFAETEAYSQIYMELAFDAKAAAEFVNGIIPSDMANSIPAPN